MCVMININNFSKPQFSGKNKQTVCHQTRNKLYRELSPTSFSKCHTAGRQAGSYNTFGFLSLAVEDILFPKISRRARWGVTRQMYYYTTHPQCRESDAGPQHLKDEELSTGSVDRESDAESQHLQQDEKLPTRSVFCAVK